MATLIRKNDAPVNTSAPTLVGSSEIGRVLFLIPGTWTSADRFTRRSYEWFKNGVQIDGAARPTYTIAGDAGDQIYGVEICTNYTGQSTRANTATVSVAAATTLTTITAASIGLKAISTTGSITTGTNSLTVASATGFTIGDTIIVEIGTEAGLGARGTVGVGGTWPALSYANAAARTADTTQANNTFAYDVDTGLVYQYVSSAWTQPDAGDYYKGTAVPIALVTTITNIAGNVMTLAANASATATNANVYFDNRPAWVAASDSSGFYRKRVSIPSGTFAFSNWIYQPSSNEAVFEGAGKELTKFKSPLGCYPMFWFIAGAGDAGRYTHIRDLQLESNFGDSGYYLMRTGRGSPDLSRGIFFENTQYHTVENCKFTNTATNAIGGSFSNYLFVYDCDVVLDDGHQSYIQWQFQLADGVGGGFWDCTVTSAYVLGGFELFRHIRGQMVRCTGVNAVFSENSGGNFFIDAPTGTITANSQKTSTFWSKLSEGFISINANIPSDLLEDGGWVRNPTFTHAAYFNANQDVLRGIIVSPQHVDADGNANVLISGGYPLNPTAGGLFTLPNYSGTIDLGIQTTPVAISSNGSAVVRGIRVIGTPPETPDVNSRPITLQGNTGIVTQCVADAIVANTEVGNQTNAEYEA